MFLERVDHQKKPLTPGCIKILYTRTYHETPSRKADIVFRVCVGAKNLPTFTFIGFAQSLTFKLKEHRIIKGRGGIKKKNKTWFRKKTRVFGWVGVSKNKKLRRYKWKKKNLNTPKETQG